MKQGVFITFEGNDGSGKTTVCKAVQEELIKMGYDCIRVVQKKCFLEFVVV